MKKVLIYLAFILISLPALSQKLEISINQGTTLMSKPKIYINEFLKRRGFNYVSREEQFYNYIKSTNEGSYEFTVSYNQNSISQFIGWSEWIGNIEAILKELKDSNFIRGKRIDANNRILIPYTNESRNLLISIIVIEDENIIKINVGPKYPNKKTL